MKAPFEAFQSDTYKDGYEHKGYAQLNHYDLLEKNKKDLVVNCVAITQLAFNCLKRACEIAQYYNWNDSDSMTDYFDVHFYLHISIGKWDKPFIVDK